LTIETKEQSSSNGIEKLPYTPNIQANKYRKFPRKNLEEIFSELSPAAYEFDQGKMSSILKQVKEGKQLNNEQSIFINNYYLDNFCSLFPDIPKENFNSWIIPFTICFVVLGIVLRAVSNGSKEGLDLLVVAGLNIIAVVFTVFTAYSSVNKTVTEWVKESKILEEDKTRLLKNFSKGKHIISLACWAIVVLVFIFELAMGCHNVLGLGNDITSIIALGLAISSEIIVNALIRHFEMQLKEDVQ